MKDRDDVPRPSGEIARKLGIAYWKLHWFIRAKKIEPPPKDENGEYLWYRRHVAAARKAFAAEQWEAWQRLKNRPICKLIRKEFDEFRRKERAAKRAKGDG